MRKRRGGKESRALLKSSEAGRIRDGEGELVVMAMANASSFLRFHTWADN
jgi:hypothetical protein